MITNPPLGPNLQALEGAGFFDKLLSTLITIFLIGGGIIFVFMLILGGIQWITAGGNKDQVESASGRIRTALIGIILLFSVFAIVRLAESIFGVSILTINIDPLIIR
jgi:cytochrome bd-type quinol oxidase subunit 2